jgi:Flp pilus assembly protein TadB
MRMLFLLAAIFVGLVAVGVIHFQKNGDNVNISIDENKLRQTTAKVVREGEQIVNSAEQSIQQGDQNQPIGQRIENGINAEAHRLVPQTQQ